ncbi:WG containing repeat-containing protein [Chryseobacterium taichungense]|uniref:WG containing repeat-containing protein n=1 Tax=Chryseobacterium taichungense TaxID=295069 RepID=A0A1H8CT09_9FLAO|nr:WG repeat-containing protein [Chryseobacterium taichungense]SEM98146.1 WG containing repeat-containing protein [Chryseobacterium taichungense]
MKKLIFVLFSSVCFGQTDQYKQILLTKKLGKEVRSYTKGYGMISDAKTGKTGIVDSLGNITYENPLKSEISQIWKNRFILKVKAGNSNGKTALINEKGEELIPLDNFRFRTWENKDRMIYTKQGKECVYDFNGKQIIPFSDKIEFASENRFFVKKNGVWLIYDFDGKQISDREFTTDLRFYKGRTYITTGEKSGEIIDNNGKTLTIISNHNVDNINAFPFLVTLDTTKNRYGIINDKENVIADEIYEQAFVGREYIYLTKDDKVSIFSKREGKIYDLDYHYVNPIFNGLFKTSQDQNNPKAAVVSLNGEIVFPKEYDRIEGFTIAGDKYLYLRKNDEEKILDKDLKNIIDEDYEIEKIFPNTLILSKDNRYYKFSPKDRQYVELKGFKEIKLLDMYPMLVGKNIDNFYGILDEEGKEVVPFIYDDITTFVGVNEFIIKKDNKFGVTNHKNEPLAEVIFDKFTQDKKGLKLIKGKETQYIYFTEQKDRNFID